MTNEPLPEDEITETTAKPVHPLRASMRKLIFTFLLVAVVWVFFAQILPQMVLESTPAQQVQVAQQAPKPNVAPDQPQQTPDAPPLMHAPPPPPPPPPEADRHFPDKAALEAKISDLEITVQRLEAKLTQREQHEPVAPEDLEKLKAQLQSQNEQTLALQQQFNGDQKEAKAQSALWQAYEALGEAARSGDPFTDALNTMAELSANNKDIQLALNALQPYSETGIATIDFLRDNFNDIIPEALAEPEDEHAKTGIVQQLRSNLFSLVKIRKVGKVEGKEPDAIIARAEVALKDANVVQAIREINTLPQTPKAAFSAWLEHAQSYQLRAQALNNLRQALVLQAQPIGNYSNPEGAL